MQTTSHKKKLTTTHRDNYDSNLIKRQSANSSTVKKEVFIIGDSIIKYVNGRDVKKKQTLSPLFMDGVQLPQG